VVVGGEMIDEKDIVEEKKLTRTVGVRAGIVV
jgi:hypothetical protein